MPAVEHDWAADSRVQGKDNSGKPRMEYVERVKKMTRDELFKETEQKIWLSAFAANNHRSDYHWHVDVCYILCEAMEEGMYEKAWKQAANQ